MFYIDSTNLVKISTPYCWGLLVQELEAEKNLKAEKVRFLGQNMVLHFGHYFLWVKDRENPSIPACSHIQT